MPIDRGIIDHQLQELGEGSRWWEQREMRDLPAVLHADERMLAISRGKVARLRWFRRSWLIVATDRRLLCLRSANRSSWRQIEVGASQIVRVALRIGPFRGRVVVGTAGHTYRLLVPRKDGRKLVNALSSVSAPARVLQSKVTPTLMVRRVIDHVLALPAAALNPTEPMEAAPVPEPVDTSMMDERVQLLEQEVEELRKQVDFLEQLLRRTHTASAVE
jgi:Bacterial PH domain